MPREKLPALRFQVADAALNRCTQRFRDCQMNWFGMAIRVIEHDRLSECAVADNGGEFGPQAISRRIVLFVSIQIDEWFLSLARVVVRHLAIAIDIQKRLTAFQRVIDDSVAVAIFTVTEGTIYIHSP